MNKIIVITILVFLFSCTNENKNDHALQSTAAPKTVEAKGYVVPKDSMAEPVVIPVDETKLKKVPVGNPKVVPTNLNVHPVGNPKVVITGKPILGQDSPSNCVVVYGRPNIAGNLFIYSTKV